jgi:hypothetical protein
MNIIKSILLTATILVSYVEVFAIGESAVITLIFPGGTRECGMGEVGTALADDEYTTYWNPAGLGVANERFDGGAVSFSQQRLLPAFIKNNDFWHQMGTVAYQPLDEKFGGFGFNTNLINMGESEWTSSDTTDTTIHKSRSYEAVYTLSYGNSLKFFNHPNHYIGINAKFIYSALAPGSGGSGNGIAKGVAFDVGYLWQFLPYLRFGLTLANMGPSVYYVDPKNRAAIPFTINTALAYSQKFSINSYRLLDINAEFRLDRELVKAHSSENKNPDPFYIAIYTDPAGKSFKRNINEINMHSGCEFTFLNTGSFRFGNLFDMVGVRNEMHYGCGIKLLNHLQFDWYIINAPESKYASGVRDEQWGLSVSLYRLLNFKKSDLLWFKETKE